MSVVPGAVESARSPERREEELLRFLRCSHILSSVLRELLEERFLHALGLPRLTRVQFCFLKLITLSPDLKMGEVARRLNVSPAATSKVIDRLEGLGLVVRTHSTGDRRTTLVAASEAGREVVSSYEQLKAAYIAPVIGGLGAGEARRLCELLELVCGGLLREQGAPAGICLRCAGYPSADCWIADCRTECGFQPRRSSREERAEVLS